MHIAQHVSYTTFIITIKTIARGKIFVVVGAAYIYSGSNNNENPPSLFPLVLLPF
jgi:hypothetical protein